jgi:hypothetical protein
MSLGISTCVHIAVILLLGCLWRESTHHAASALVDTRWAPTELVTELTPYDQPPAERTQTNPQEGMNKANPVSFPVKSRVSREMPVSVAPTAPAASAAPVSATDEFGDVLPSEALTEQMVVSAVGSGDLGSGQSSRGSGGDFFGMRASGRRFVFVVDCSRSMNHAHESEAGTRLGRLKMELTRSIGSMGPDMQFFIVFFNDRVYPMPASSMQVASPRSQEVFLRWMTTIPADGNTDPRDALRFALRLRPDVIYFLTDGRFPTMIGNDLLKLTQPHTAIHTLALGKRSGEEVLKAIAAHNRGRYRFIP